MLNRDTFLVLSCSSDVPSVSQAYLLENQLSLKMEKNLQTTQVLLSAHTTKSPVLKVELAGSLETLGLNNICSRRVKINSLLFLFSCV
jgi:hypothetical protein